MARGGQGGCWPAFLAVQRSRNHSLIECGEFSPLSAGDLSPSNWLVHRVSSEPLHAALPGRQVGQAAKAETSLRTPKPCRKGAGVCPGGTSDNSPAFQRWVGGKQ